MPLIFFLFWSFSALADDITGRASVIDGDTIVIQKMHIRLFGIDAPEGKQICKDAQGKDYRCGQKAALVLADKIGQTPINCKYREIDQHGRIVGVCYLGKENLNRWMVSEGWAVAYRYFSKDYVRDEEEAKQAKRGIWAGSFMMPYDFRKGRN